MPALGVHSALCPQHARRTRYSIFAGLSVCEGAALGGAASANVIRGAALAARPGIERGCVGGESWRHPVRTCRRLPGTSLADRCIAPVGVGPIPLWREASMALAVVMQRALWSGVVAPAFTFSKHRARRPPEPMVSRRRFLRRPCALRSPAARGASRRGGLARWRADARQAFGSSDGGARCIEIPADGAPLKASMRVLRALFAGLCCNRARITKYTSRVPALGMFR